MKQTLMVNIQIDKNDNSYVFSLPMGAPIGEAYDAAHECLQEIVKMGQNAMNSAKRPENISKENDGQ